MYIAECGGWWRGEVLAWSTRNVSSNSFRHMVSSAESGANMLVMLCMGKVVAREIRRMDTLEYVVLALSECIVLVVNDKCLTIWIFFFVLFFCFVSI